MFHVEHRRLSILLTILLVTLVGCKSENPNPELLDPIYADLKKEAEAAGKAIEAELKERESAQIAISKAPPNSMELRDAEKMYWKSNKKIEVLRPIELYYKIHAERRRVEGRAAYRMAFSKGGAWPDPAEFQGYETNKRLRSADRNWSKRVPKLASRVPASKGGGDGKKEAKKEEKKEE